MKYGFDVSNYVPAPDAVTFSAICYSERIQRAVLACDPQTLDEWYPLVQSRNLELDVYYYMKNQENFETEIQNAANFLSNAGIARTQVANFWLDVEDSATPAPTFLQLSQAIGYAKQLFNPADVGIYTSEYLWSTYNNPQVGSLCKLWLANWNLKEPWVFGVWFGGWVRASGIQYAGDYQTFGVTMDMSVWDE